MNVNALVASDNMIPVPFPSAPPGLNSSVFAAQSHLNSHSGGFLATCYNCSERSHYVSNCSHPVQKDGMTWKMHSEGCTVSWNPLVVGNPVPIGRRNVTKKPPLKKDRTGKEMGRYVELEKKVDTLMVAVVEKD